MGVVIYVDNRERALIEFKEQLYTNRGPDYALEHGNPVEWRVGKMDVGDIQIYDAKSTTHLVFERKTFQDIAGSIKDGRYREQKARLLAHYRPEQIIYILEDFNTQLLFTIRSPRTSFFGLSKSTYEGFYYNTIYRDKIHIHRSSGIEETFCFILELAKRIYNDGTIFPKATLRYGIVASASAASAQPAQPAQPAGGGTWDNPDEPDDPADNAEGVANFNPFKEYIDSCKIKEKKIKNITPLVCFQLQLGQIPYISASISKHISQRYTSMKELLADLNRVSDAERMALLTQIPLVGKKKALSILEFLGFSQNTPTPTPSSTDAITQEIKNEINDCPSNEL